MAKAKYSADKNGIYWAKCWDGTFNSDGTKHRINLKSKKSSRDLERQVNALAEQVRDGQSRTPSEWMFQDYARHWLSVKKSVREKNTQAMYDNVVEKHLAFLADVRLTDVRHSHFDQAIANASSKPRTCQIIYITFCQIIRMAVSDHYITKDEYSQICDDVNLPKYIRSENRPLTEVERVAFKDCLASDVFTPREKAFLLLIYYCGLRKGEALALTRFDFSFARNKNVVSITKSLIFVKNDPQIKSCPKSDRGFRIVPLPDEAADYLKQYIADLPDSNLFYCDTCKLITKSSYDKMWPAIRKKLNVAAGGTDAFPLISDLTAHNFRHNYCTCLCYKVPEISIKKIAQLMGDTIEVVLKVYNHVMEEKENASDVVNDALAM